MAIASSRRSPQNFTPRQAKEQIGRTADFVKQSGKFWNTLRQETKDRMCEFAAKAILASAMETHEMKSLATEAFVLELDLHDEIFGEGKKGEHD
jgi:hypothetical protein